MNPREAIKSLTDDIADLAMRRADEWAEQGLPHIHVGAALMTAAVHSAARMVMTVAFDDANPKDFIKNTAPIIAQQIVDYADPIMDEYVAALAEAEQRQQLQ